MFIENQFLRHWHSMPIYTYFDLESVVQCRLIAILMILNDMLCKKAMQIFYRRPASTSAATVEKIQPILKLSISSLNIFY